MAQKKVAEELSVFLSTQGVDSKYMQCMSGTESRKIPFA